MEFTYKAYENLMALISASGYKISKFHEGKDEKYKQVILRHDVDWSVEKAYEFAAFEKKLGVKSAYFFQIRADGYNIYSARNTDYIQEIYKMGHDIGLHFDETVYADGDMENHIRNEAVMMNKMLGIPIQSVSMHRPSKKTLEGDIRIEGLINTYSSYYFNTYKYLSDSRCHWKEDIEEIIRNGSFTRIQLLTHPIWYNEISTSMENTLMRFIDAAKYERYAQIKDNITDTDAIFAGNTDFVKELQR